jgi:tetratricopeptide (TPR) repeat protein/DNA-binding XRE family transcriptional regulator
MTGEAADFADMLRQLRAQAGLTQEELAGAAGVGVNTVGDLEQRRHQRTHKPTAERLANALGLHGQVRDLFIAVARGRAPAVAADAAMAGPGGAEANPPAWTPAPRAGSLVPRQLPADVAAFTGRESELAELDFLLPGTRPQEPDPKVGPVVISAVSGTAGVGKTALAVHWAHRVADAFPDGQLYVNLRGYDPDQPVPVAEALAGFLRALGVPDAEIPLEEDERAAQLRSAVAGRRLLMILDNAGSVEQVRPLLPGSPTVMVVVTSRDALAGLVARDGAVRLEVELLPAAEAAALLYSLVGTRAAADPASVATLAAQCACLPLALRLAAELAIARPETSLGELSAELAALEDRLALLDAGGDTRGAVASVFSWSYRHLPADTARMFRLLGLHPAADFDGEAAAALAGVEVARARQLLGLLTRAHLIQLTGGGRYGMHDLLRAYAASQAAQCDGRQTRRAALTRLFDYYLATCAAALDCLAPAERQHRPATPPAAPAVPNLPDRTAALAWLEAELVTLTAVAAYTAVHGWASHTTRLATILTSYLDENHPLQAVTIHTHALDAARASADQAAQAHALVDLGRTHFQRGDYQQAIDCYDQALTLARELNDHSMLARALGSLATAHGALGRYGEAINGHQQALEVYRDLNDQLGEVINLSNIGLTYFRQGSYQEASSVQQQALALCRDLDDQYGVVYALNALGEISCHQGQHEQAESYLQQALQVGHPLGAQSLEAVTLTRLADVYGQQQRIKEATTLYQQALTICRQTGDRDGEADALIGTSHILVATGQITQARACLTTALALARQTRDPYQQARALQGLAAACHAAGQHDQARQHEQQARDIHAALGITRPATNHTQPPRSGPGRSTGSPPGPGRPEPSRH